MFQMQLLKNMHRRNQSIILTKKTNYEKKIVQTII